MADFAGSIVPTLTSLRGQVTTRAGRLVDVLGSTAVAGSPPTIAYITPPGPVDPPDVIVIDALDADSPAPDTFLFVRLAGGGIVDVVWDGAAFTPQYATSLRVPVANGHRFTLRRLGDGWPPGSITFNGHAFDDTGNKAT